MGRILTIRLQASTHDEAQVFQAWPHACALAWPNAGEIAGKEWMKKAAPAILGTAAIVPHGVVELGEALLEQARFADWKLNVVAAMKPELAKLETALGSLETALGDWKPKEAHEASLAIEDSLDAIEQMAQDSI